LLLLLAGIVPVQAQKKYLLTVISNDTVNKKGFVMPDYQKKFDIASLRTNELQNLLLKLYSDAYLAASFDSLVQDSLMLKAYVTCGERYEWARLTKGNVDEGVLSQVGYSEKLYRHKPLYYKDALRLMDKLLVFYENNGYPFAQVQLDSIKLEKNQVSASLSLTKKKLEKIDSIVVKGDLKLSPEYLYGYLGIRPGDVYDESKVKVISNRLRALPFLYETKSAQVIFVQDKAKIFLFLGKKSANQFNGIVGILPNSTTGGINITGDISLQLQNSFHHAEELGFHWQHIQAQTENLTAHVSYPYLFHTTLGIDDDFTLFKQDTTYLQLDEKIGLKYLMIGGNYWKLFYENITSSLLSTSTLQGLTTLPPYADVTTELYGIEYSAKALDYIYNPRSGYEILVNVAAGTKEIHKNPKLDPQIYDSLQLSSAEYRANINAACFIPFFSRSTFELALKGGYIDAPSLLRNDLYRIGGFAVLRGFPEQSIYANEYSVGTVEFHYLLEQNSFFFLFFDQGWYQRNVAGLATVRDTPYGFGAGMDFQTKAGIFSLSYALGSQAGYPISFKDGIINFGLINNF